MIPSTIDCTKSSIKIRTEDKSLNPDLSVLSNEIDIFHADSFEKVINERLKANLDFYLCLVREGTKNFFFEAAHFIEYYEKISEKLNPLTKREIIDFEFLILDSNSKNFSLVMTGLNGCKYPNYLIFIANDHCRTQLERSKVFYTLGYIYETGSKGVNKNLDTSFDFFSKASGLGHVGANIPIGIAYEKNNDFKQAEIFYRKSALKGNYFALSNLIRLYRNHNIKIEEKWTEFLPETIKDKACIEYYNSYFTERDFDLNHINMFKVTEELASDNSLQFSRKPFPTNKKI